MNKFSKIFCLALGSCLFFSTPKTFSQQEGNFVCGTDAYYNQMKQIHPELEKKEQLANEMAKAYMNQPEAQKKKAEPRVIPVVFHVVHGGGDENLDRATLLDNLESLNEDFQKRNHDTADVRPIFKDRIADYNIEFRLARKKPTGECFNGITREYHPTLTDDSIWLRILPNYTDRINYWNPEHYLNIWVVEDIYDNNPNSDVAGQSNYPWSNNGADGIIMRADQIEYQGRTLTHEAGHYLGLYHPFYNGCETGDCKNQNDKVCDVPPTAERQTVRDCSQLGNTCTDTSGLPDMKENYMDYTNCRHMFSKGQKNRSDAYLYDTQYRKKLISDQNLARAGVKSEISGIPAAFFRVEDTSLCQGNQIQFENLSCAGTADSIEWHFEGGTPEKSGKSDPVVQYKKAGTYDVSLKLINSDGTDSLLKAGYIEVLESPKAPVEYRFRKGEQQTKGFRLEENAQGNRWKISGNVGIDDAHSLYLSNYNLREEQEVAFRLPPIDFSGIGDPVLRFEMALATKSENSGDILFLQNSGDCGDSWKDLDLIFTSAMKTKSNVSEPYFPESLNEWKTHKVDLSSLNNDTNALIKFVMQTKKGNNAFIDNIRVESESTSVQESKASEKQVFKFHPNPVKDQLSITYTGPRKTNGELAVYSLSGQRMFAKTFDWRPNSSKNLAPTELNIKKSGIYIFKISTENQTIVKRIAFTR